jgi:mannose-1-phosphate guanylyltransferase
VLAGGIGSRFWPLSTPERPKQLLPLADEHSLLAGTLRRLGAVVPPERTLILTNESLRDAVIAIASDFPAANVIGEPRAAGTAAPLAWAASEIQRRAGADAVMVSVHADWSIEDEAGFAAALRHAIEVAEHERALVTIGIVPTRPDPGFGYIEPAEEVFDGACRVARFVEKPDRARARTMVDAGYLWNSGIFVWRVGDFLDEVRAHTPEVAPALAHSADLARFFAEVRPVSVDVGVLERTTRLLVLPGDFGWDDVGTWASLRRVRSRDAAGNAASGRVHVLGASDNVVHAEGNAVILYGVSDLVVVTCDGLTLVTTLERAADLKTLLDSLPPDLRDCS